MMYVLGVLVPNITTCYILFQLFKGVYECKYPKPIYFFSYVFMVTAQCLITFLRVPFLSLATFTCFAILLCKIGYSGSNNRIIYTILFIIYLASIDMFVVPVFSKITNMTVRQTLNSGQSFFVTGIIGAIIELCSYRWVLRAVMKHKVKELKKNQEIFIVFLGCFELGTIHMISQLANYSLAEINSVVIGICLGFLIIDAYLIVLFESVSHKNELQMQMRLWEQQTVMNERYLEQIEIQNEHYRKVMHDIKRHLRIIKGTGSVDEEYCDEVLELVDWKGVRFKCSNQILNRILNDKILLCETKGMEVKLDIDDVNLGFVRKSDITTIFMNLFDNAIEACEEAENKTIVIKIREMQGSIVVVFKNSCKENVLISSINGSSSKKGHMGVGLSNVRMALARYGSKLEIECKDHIFTAKFIIMKNWA